MAAVEALVIARAEAERIHGPLIRPASSVEYSQVCPHFDGATVWHHTNCRISRSACSDN